MVNLMQACLNQQYNTWAQQTADEDPNLFDLFIFKEMKGEIFDFQIMADHGAAGHPLVRTELERRKRLVRLGHLAPWEVVGPFPCWAVYFEYFLRIQRRLPFMIQPGAEEILLLPKIVLIRSMRAFFQPL